MILYIINRTLTTDDAALAQQAFPEMLQLERFEYYLGKVMVVWKPLAHADTVVEDLTACLGLTLLGTIYYRLGYTEKVASGVDE